MAATEIVNLGASAVGATSPAQLPMPNPALAPALHPAPGPIDALTPPDMARKAVAVAISKARLDARSVFLLSVLAGAFIALGAIFSLTATSGAGASGSAIPYGVTRVIAGIAFSLGLVLVVVGGAELFTGNVLLTFAWASRRISTGTVLRNWLIVYLGNLVGSIGTVALVIAGGWYRLGGGSVGAGLLSTAEAKVGHTPLEAFTLGILCNVLVCLAVWLTYSARTTTDRIMAVVPPVTCFVAAGFEHSIANMFFIPAAIAVRALAPASFWTSIGSSAGAYPTLDMGGFISNLVPVTAGNIVGGALLVAATYWLAYLRPRSAAAGEQPAADRGRRP
jgi:formate transporter